MINVDAFTFNCLDHIFIVDRNYKIVYRVEQNSDFLMQEHGI